MADNGEEKLIAVARHLAKTLGHTDNAFADDILQIFSNFDGRFKQKLNHNTNFDQTVKNLDRRISKYLTVDLPIWSNSVNAQSFLQSVDELTLLIRDCNDVVRDDHTVDSISIDRAEDLLQQCMFRLEEEFKRLMSESEYESIISGLDSRDSSDESVVFEDENDDDEVNESDVPVANRVSDYNITIDALPASTVNDLNEISKRMVSAGYGKELSYVYSTFRKEFIEESLSRLGFTSLQNKSSRCLIDSDADNDVEIEKWSKAIKMCVKVLYPSERMLCDRVFGFSCEAADLSFMDVCKVSVMDLLNFASGIAMGSKAPERLFTILDVYETIKDLLSEFEVLFSDDYSLFLRNEAVAVWKRLGESIRGIFTELENLIRRDSVKTMVPGGGLHPITRYVMNYLRAACSRATLKQVFDEKFSESLPSSSLSVQITWIMEILESNLVLKARVYRDPALSAVFMMNNERYIVKKVKDDELGTLLGDDWIRKQTSKVRQHHVNFQRSSWHKVVNTLKLDNSNLSSNVASKGLKDKLKVFNSQFDEICRTQSTWAIFDDQLREELKISVAGTLLPAYRNFLGRFHHLQDIGKYADKHVKFSIEDVEARIDDLFQATAVSGSSRK
ncbi:exocyst complex component EXO70B1-like [Rutidosis leptorrhynchoides]|uniref:exocyst complex component EXO70B1-like n=1 Tax=Rutidosis leptorrhynchoides TaxID=125765 RepID=UPI003A998DBD